MTDKLPRTLCGANDIDLLHGFKIPFYFSTLAILLLSLGCFLSISPALGKPAEGDDGGEEDEEGEGDEDGEANEDEDAIFILVECVCV